MKSLILATAAVLAIGTGAAFAAPAMAQSQHRVSGTQSALQAPGHNTVAANSNGNVVYSGTSNELFPVPQGGA